MSSLTKLQERYPRFISLTTKDEESTLLEPLFTHILNGLTAYEDNLQKMGTQFDIYNKDVRQQKMDEFLSKCLNGVTASPLTELKKLEARLDEFHKGQLSIIHQPEATDPMEKLSQRLRDGEIRADLAQMKPADRIKILSDTCQAGKSEILEAIQRQPSTKQLIPQEEMDRAGKMYLDAVAPTQAPDTAMFESVVAQGKAAMSLIDVSRRDIDGRMGIASKVSVKVY